jgi:hypothetical protein
MKIGILLSVYNSEEYIDECLRPWINLKNEFKKFRVEVTLNKQIIHNEFIHI